MVLAVLFPALHFLIWRQARYGMMERPSSAQAPESRDGPEDERGSMGQRPSARTPERAPERPPAGASGSAFAPEAQPWQDAEDLRWAARHWATRVGVPTPRIHIRAMSKKWASISTAGRLTLNSELVGLPRELGEFVIVHELVHLLAPNHGRVFKSFLHAYLPDWQQRERELRRYEGTAARGRALRQTNKRLPTKGQRQRGVTDGR